MTRRLTSADIEALRAKGVRVTEMGGPRSSPSWPNLTAPEPGVPAVGRLVARGNAKAPKPTQRKMNKTEAALMTWLQADPENARVEYERVTLKLGDDLRYTPDFYVLKTDGRVVFYEAKGFWRDDAFVKIKTAAEMFSEFKFISAQRKDGAWKFREF